MAAKKTTKKTAAAKKAAKRVRNSKPLYAEVSLGKLSQLLGNKKDATVVVSRNFVLELKKEELEQKALEDLKTN